MEVMMSIETMYEMDKKQAKIYEYVANLKESPKQVTQYINQVINGDEFQVVSITDNLDMHSYFKLLVK